MFVSHDNGVTKGSVEPFGQHAAIGQSRNLAGTKSTQDLLSLLRMINDGNCGRARKYLVRTLYK